MARASRVLMLLGGLAAAAFALGFVVFANVAAREAPPVVAAADGIVVLTGTDDRIVEGVRLLRRGLARRLLISGVNPRTRREDLRRLARSGIQQIDSRIDLGYDAQDTTGNADETRTWAARWRFKRLIVVTSSYHMPRSLIELGLVLPGVALIPHAVVPSRLRQEPWWAHVGTARMLAAEYLKLIPSAARFAAARLLRPVEVHATATVSASPRAGN
jgi:uncharacterized SAM-binding protein YcdF (DUF218 family)